MPTLRLSAITLESDYSHTEYSYNEHLSASPPVAKYNSRRGNDGMGAWQRITKGQSIVCLNGNGGFYNQGEKDGKYRLWTWAKFKSKKGCYSYFGGECNTDGCSKGKCPRS